MTEPTGQQAPGAAAQEQPAGQTSDRQQQGPSAEERAEALMERTGAQVGRFLARAVARTREEIEDVVAEAKAMRRGQQPDEGGGPQQSG